MQRFYNPMTCPCGRRVCVPELRDTRGRCPECGVELRVSEAYQRWTTLSILAVVVLIGFLTHKPSSGGTWFLGVALLWIPLRIVVSRYFPPSLEGGKVQPKFSVMGSVFTCAMTVFLVEFVLGVGAHLLLGGSKQEFSEHLGMLSIPLGWLTPAFVVRPESGFIDVCGIIFANSFCYGIPMFVCVRVVQRVLDRNRPIQIGITGQVGDDDEES